MKPKINIFFTSIACWLVFITFQEWAFAQDKSEVIYQCAPCGCSSDGKHFDEPGACSSCGMKLIAVSDSDPFSYLKNLDEQLTLQRAQKKEGLIRPSFFLPSNTEARIMHFVVLV